MQPTETHKDGCPVFEAEQFDGVAHISNAVQLGEIPVPCWIRAGRTSMKIEAGKLGHAFARGLLLAAVVADP